MPLVLLARAVALLPWSSLRWLGALIGAIAGSILRIRRAHVLAAAHRARLSDPPAVARGMYASLGTAVFEFLWLVGRRTAHRSLLIPSARASAVLHKYGGASRSRGVVIATAHTGNWDLVACAAAAHLPLTVVTKRLSVGWLDRFWQRERAVRGIELLHGAGAFRGAALALSRGRSVAVLIDQAPDRSTAVATASFMGQRVFCDLMPALLAARTGAPLVLALGYRNADGAHAVDVPLTLEPPAKPSRAWVEEATRRLNDALEAFVRERPSQWLWLHRRWKSVPSRPARRVAAAPLVC
jgi:Kdo2-lipid IVA lauroyltransferase/acyltransferase